MMVQNLKLGSTTNFLARWNKQNIRANQINGRKAMALKLLFMGSPCTHHAPTNNQFNTNNRNEHDTNILK